MAATAGLGRWQPHELRHSAASLLSAAGIPLQEIADVLGHTARVTSSVCWHRTTPVVEAGAGPMAALFRAQADADPVRTAQVTDEPQALSP